MARRARPCRTGAAGQHPARRQLYSAGLADRHARQRTAGTDPRTATVADGLPAIQGRQFKGVTAPEGRPRSWFGPPPVFRAIDVLAAVSPHPQYLFARSAADAGSYRP